MIDEVETWGQSGFTLIELTLAMTLFSFIFLIISVGFITIVHLQQAGLASRKTQHNSRFAMESIIRDARGASKVTISPGLNAFYKVICFNSTTEFRRYYAVGATMRQLRTDTEPCTSASTAGQLVMTDEVGLSFLDASTTTAFPASLSIRLGVTTADDPAILTPDGEACVPSAGGSQFCSVTTLQSSVSLRGPK